MLSAVVTELEAISSSKRKSDSQISVKITNLQKSLGEYIMTAIGCFKGNTYLIQRLDTEELGLGSDTNDWDSASLVFLLRCQK